MPRYFLNVRTHRELIPDPEGQEVADLEDIKCEVEATIQDILRRPETYGENARWDRCTFEVTNEAGELVLRMPFSEFAEDDPGVSTV